MSGKEAAEQNQPKKQLSIFNRYANFVAKHSSNTFYTFGENVGTRPGAVMLVMGIICLLFGIGISTLYEENRGDKLWVPQDTPSVDDRELYESLFESNRREYLIAEPRDGNSILTKDNLVEAMLLYQNISALSVTVDGEEESLSTLCVKDFSNGDPCLIVSVLENWRYSLEDLQQQDDLSVLSQINTNTLNYLEQYLGGIEVNEDGNVTSAAALKMTFFIESNRETEGGAYVDEKGEKWEEAYLDLLRDDTAPGFPNLKVYPEAVRSIGDEFGEAISSDINLITLAYVILIIYISINLGRLERTCVKLRASLSFFVIVTVGMSIISSYGLAALLGFMYTPLHSILPFILLGIGVDDSFVIADSFDATSKKETTPVRTAKALSHAGVSITITSATDFVAFAISSVSSLPALSSFCVYASIGVVFLFIYQVTFFTAALAIDSYRQQSNRKDIICCIKAKENPSAEKPTPIEETEENKTKNAKYEMVSTQGPSNAEEGVHDGAAQNQTIPTSEVEIQEIDKKNVKTHNDKGINSFLRNYYAPFLLHPITKVLVLLSFSLLLAMMIVGLLQLSVESSERSFIPDGSYLLETLDKNDEYFGERGVEVDIVTYDYDHFQYQEVLGDMQITLDGLENKSPYIKDPYGPTYSSWYTSYVEWLQTDDAPTVQTDGNGRPTVESEFYSSIETFLNTSQGLQFNSSVVRQSLSGSPSFKATKIEAEYVNFNSYNRGRLQVDARKAVRAMEDLRDICDSFPVPVFPWTYQYINWELFAILEQELYQSLGLSLLAVVLIVFLFIGSPVTTLLIAGCVASTLACILGTMFYWDLVIDNVSVINLILAVGLAVDYSAHVGHTFMLVKGTNDERVTDTLGSIGAAVLNGAISTFLAVCLLSASASYVFRVLFRQFFATVVLGAGHGLILLPVLLSYVGPAAFEKESEGEGVSVGSGKGVDAVELTKVIPSKDTGLVVQEDEENKDEVL